MKLKPVLSREGAQVFFWEGEQRESVGRREVREHGENGEHTCMKKVYGTQYYNQYLPGKHWRWLS